MKTTLLFGIHCHQPIDNFDEVVFDAIEKSYKPFFKVLKNYPNFKISVHYSGWLLEFIYKHDKELFTLMQEMSGQIEFFSGGYYEPILASIPAKDRVGQIKKLNQFIKKHFNQTPKGLWLTERVWDNSVIQDIKKCGIEYVIVDDYHFIASGYDKNNLKGYFITEEGGESIGLFPIDKELRYSIPFVKNSEVNRLLRSYKNINSKNAAIIFDDGEKFGIWPKTYQNVYEKEWLKEFIETTLKDKEIEVATFRDYYENQKPISLAYLPTVSYFEMGEWSLKAKDTLLLERLNYSINEGNEFLKGGIWKNFLTKFQESNWINKRTVELSKKQTTKHYKEALYKAQCNDTLWHGVFGGLYLPNLRDNAYRYIIECENLLFEKEGVEEIDIDFDFYKEYKISSRNLLAIISAKNGAGIMEFDLKESNFNLQNTLSRYEEAYHSKIEKVEEKENSDELETIHNASLKTTEDINLYYDWYLKKSLIDHISDDSFTLENFESCSFKEFGDFANQSFDFVEAKKTKVKFSRDGGIFTNQKYNTKIDKTIELKDDRLNFEIKLISENEDKLTYINEWNLHFANIENITINSQIPTKPFSLNTNSLKIKDNYLNKIFEFKFKNKIDILIYPLKTVSQSEKGVDYTIQGVSFGFKVDFEKELNFSGFMKMSSIV